MKTNWTFSKRASYFVKTIMLDGAKFWFPRPNGYSAIESVQELSKFFCDMIVGAIYFTFYLFGIILYYVLWLPFFLPWKLIKIAYIIAKFSDEDLDKSQARYNKILENRKSK